jgi:hypothetical protein
MFLNIVSVTSKAQINIRGNENVVDLEEGVC